jgi:hypothetical protein
MPRPPGGPDHREVIDHPYPADDGFAWRRPTTTPVHSTGVALTVLVAMPTLFFAANLLFSGTCGAGPTAGEVRAYRLWFLADVAGFAAVPVAVGVWAWRRGRLPWVWWTLAVGAVLAGAAFALTTEPTPLFCF